MDRRQQSRVFVDLPVQIWGMDTYSVQRNNSGGGFWVRVTGVDGNWHVASGFGTKLGAQRWIDDQIRLALQSAITSGVA